MSARLKKILKSPKLLFFTLGHRELLNFISDEKYLKIGYKIKFGKKLNLDSPKTFNEKLQWLKLNDRNPLYTKLVDKADVKEYVKARIGEKYIIPTIGVYDKFEDINFDLLPNSFVIKCTHDSGGLIVCKDKSKLDIKAAKKKINACLKHSFYWGQREWPYKDVKPRVIVEQYMEDEKNSELRDYKFFCFDGEVKALFIATERQKAGEEVKFDFFDENFNHLPIRQGHPNAKVPPEKPENFEEMKVIASKLSEGIHHVSVDFYEVNGQIYFGELTFYHFSGFVPFVPEEWDYCFGEWLKI